MPDRRSSRVGVVLLFDVAIPLLRRGIRPKPLPLDVERVFCIGCPTLNPSAEVLAWLSAGLGMPVEPWPDGLSADAETAVLSELSARSHQIDAALPATVTGFPWSRLKANDRVLYRMKSFGLVEALLDNIMRRHHDLLVIVPWIAERFGLVERPGMMGFDAPGHQVTATLDRLNERHSFGLHRMWPERLRWERWQIRAAHVAMTAARVLLLLGRTVRARFENHGEPASRVPAANRPRIGFVVGGASHWSALRPLVRTVEQSCDVVLIASDIFRSPTAYRTLRQSGEQFVSIDALLGLRGTVRQMLRALVERWRIERALRASAAATLSIQGQEQALIASADAASLPELRLYVAQVRKAIDRFALKAVVSANNIDSYLGATTVAAHDAGIPHVCIHNTALESVPLPIYADCDLYVTGSQSYADYLSQAGAVGRVEPLGLPSYDELIKYKSQTPRGAFLRRYPQFASRRIVGVATQAEFLDFTVLLNELITWASGRSDVALAVKLHPREPGGAYRHELRRLVAEGCGGYLADDPLPDFLVDCDCVIAGSSTSLFWAVLMGVPTFSWEAQELGHVKTRLDYLDPRLTPKAATAKELVPLLTAHVTRTGSESSWSAARARYLTEQLTGADGRACDRILHQIEAMSGRSAVLEGAPA